MRNITHYIFGIVIMSLWGVTLLSQTINDHPRLYFNAKQINNLKGKSLNPFVDSLIIKPLLKEATKKKVFIDTPEKAILNTSLAYLITEDKEYLNNALHVLDKILNAPGEWHKPPYKYKNLKYMSVTGARKAYALAIAYDMLYHQLPDSTKETIRQALIQKIFTPYLKAFAKFDSTKQVYTDINGHQEWWTQCYFPWNPKVNGMIGVAALATLGEIPESTQVLKMARFAIKKSHTEFITYFKDGSYQDGPAYFVYYLSHAIRFYAALENCMNTDDGFFELPGIQNAANFITDFTAPDSTFVAYGYTPSYKFKNKHDELYYLVKKDPYHNHINYFDDHLLYGGNLPFALMWRPRKKIITPEYQKQSLKCYDNNWAFVNDKRFYATLRGGDNAVRKSHPEAGELKIWLDDVKFLSDGDYLNAESPINNTLFFNNHGQVNPENKLFFSGDSSIYRAKIVSCESIRGNEYVKMNLTNTYENLKYYYRHVLLTNLGHLIVIDDVEIKDSVEVSQSWHTPHILEKKGDKFVFAMHVSHIIIHTYANVPFIKEIIKTNNSQNLSISTEEDTNKVQLINIFIPGALKKSSFKVNFDIHGVSISTQTKKKSSLYQFNKNLSGLYFSGEITK
ncbi:DUF4962 domain-containing protein [Labilibacter sediminis]|nr:DUF4962 domain-containing protein [Labilibacter sediminis]